MNARIHHLLDRSLEQGRDAPFIVLPNHTLSFADVDAMAQQVEAELRSLNVRAGDRVMVVAENCPEHAALIFACSRIGAWSCGVNARMAPAEIDAFAARADARVVYFTTSASASAQAHATRYHATASYLPGMSHSAVKADSTPETGPLQTSVAGLIFTSGTTGQPKGVMIGHDALCHFATQSAQSRALSPADRCYAFVPMTHIFGLATVMLTALQARAQLVMRPQFDPADLLDALAHHGVSQLQGPPALYSRLLAYLQEQGIERIHAPALRFVYTGAGPLDMALKQRVEAAFGQTLHHGYGLSEYAGSMHITRLGEWRHDTSAGYAVCEAEVQVTDPATGQPMPYGQRGELWVRGRGLMPGYFRDPEATAAVMRPGGWYASGDLGEMAEDGALWVVGRLKEMIIRSGFNVYPAEVEAALNAFPSIERSAVIGRKEADGNEQVLAFVELRPGCTLEHTALHAHLREQLAPYKRPTHIEVMETLPTNPNGKILKRILQEQAATLSL